MNGLDLLELVYWLLPSAFFLDLVIFMFGVWWIRRWRRHRAFRQRIAPYSHFPR